LGGLKKKMNKVTIHALTVESASLVHPFDYPQSESCPDEFMAYIEISAGSNIKYEWDEKTRNIKVSRFQSMPVVYPANYGFITKSKGGDGDPLDVLVFASTPLSPGTFIQVRPIGILKMIDGGEEDEKVIAVPASVLDPTYDRIKTITDMPEMDILRIEAFFRVYKQLPVGRKTVELHGFGGVDEASECVKNAIDHKKAENTDDARTPFIHPFDYPQSDSFPEEIEMVIEIPAGSTIQYKIEEDTGQISVSRFLLIPMLYLGNFGSITQTRNDDGQPLNALVFTRAPLYPGTIIRARPIGLLKMIDSGKAITKVIAVPASKVDPTYDSIRTISDLPEMELQRMESFFHVFEQLWTGREVNERQPFSGLDEANKLLKDANEIYNQWISTIQPNGSSTVPL
jgi:inorganic pyrophosphatase